MNWPALLVSVVLVAPAVVHSQQPGDAKGRAITLRACVKPGTHGAIGALDQVEEIAPARTMERRTIYWFYKNLGPFKDHIGYLVEVSGTISETLAGPVELKATDGVFAQIDRPPAKVADAASAGAAVGTSGTATQNAVAAVAATEPASEEPTTTILKVEVNNLKMLGSCR